MALGVPPLEETELWGVPESLAGVLELVPVGSRAVDDSQGEVEGEREEKRDWELTQEPSALGETEGVTPMERVGGKGVPLGKREEGVGSRGEVVGCLGEPVGVSGGEGV